MADNVVADPGALGATFATDDIGGIHYPISKITIGALDSSTLLTGGNGVTDAGTIRVTVSSDSAGVLTVDNAGSFATQATLQAGTAEIGNVKNAGVFVAQVDGAALAALQLIDNLVHTGSDVALLSHVPISGQFDDAATTTVTENQVAPVRITSARALHVTQQGVVTVADGGSFTLAANSGVDIGDVDVTSVVPGVAAANLGKAEDAVHTTGDQTADAALAGTSGDYAPLQLDATGFLKVNIKAGSASGTEYTEDAVAPANPAGGAVSLVRQDTPATITSANGDIVAQRATDYGAAFVQILDSSGNFINSFGGSGGTSHADDAAFSIGSASSITPAGYLADETTPDSVDEGDVGVPRMTLSRKPYAVIADATSEFSAAVDASGNLQVDIAADSVGIGGGIQYTEAATDATITGTAMMFEDAADTLRVATGNIANGLDVDVTRVSGTVTVDGSAVTQPVSGTVTVTHPQLGGGTESVAQRVTIASDSTGVLTVDNGGSFLVQAAQSGAWNITNISGTVSLPTGASTATNQSTANTALQLIDNPVVAHDAPVSGSTGVSVSGLEARLTDPTAVASADATRAIATLLGKQVTVPYAIPGSTWQYAGVSGGITDTSDDMAKAAAGAAVRNYITSVQVINGHATVGTEVVIKDGSTVIWRGWAEKTGGGAAAKFDPPLRGTADTAVNVTNITTGAKTYFNLQGFTAAE